MTGFRNKCFLHPYISTNTSYQLSIMLVEDWWFGLFVFESCLNLDEWNPSSPSETNHALNEGRHVFICIWDWKLPIPLTLPTGDNPTMIRALWHFPSQTQLNACPDTTFFYSVIWALCSHRVHHDLCIQEHSIVKCETICPTVKA